jgi:hypothetical protein
MDVAHKELTVQNSSRIWIVDLGASRRVWKCLDGVVGEAEW